MYALIREYRLATSVAEAVRFELTMGCPMPPFQGGALDRYATPPMHNEYSTGDVLARDYRHDALSIAVYVCRGRVGPRCAVLKYPWPICKYAHKQGAYCELRQEFHPLCIRTKATEGSVRCD